MVLKMRIVPDFPNSVSTFPSSPRHRSHFPVSFGYKPPMKCGGYPLAISIHLSWWAAMLGAFTGLFFIGVPTLEKLACRLSTRIDYLLDIIVDWVPSVSFLHSLDNHPLSQIHFINISSNHWIDSSLHQLCLGSKKPLSLDAVPLVHCCFCCLWFWHDN